MKLVRDKFDAVQNQLEVSWPQSARLRVNKKDSTDTLAPGWVIILYIECKFSFSMFSS